jgi:CubicO group peptidase (beta-lactamase class C family)
MGNLRTKPSLCTRAWHGMPGSTRRGARVDGGRERMRRARGALLSLRARVGLVGVGVVLSALVASPADATTTRRVHLAHLRRQLACVPWPTHGWPTGPLPAGVDPAKVRAAADTLVGPGRADSVVVIHGGRLVYEQYAPGVTADSIEPSFSISKSFTSTVIGLLVDQKALKLDAPAPIPEWSSPTDARHAITLRNLLHMASGLQWNEDYSLAPDSDVLQMVLAGDEAGYAVSRPLANPPGTVWNYSTGDTAVLGRIIADTAGVSGDAYLAYLHRVLFDPLGIDPVEPGFDSVGHWLAGWQTNTTTRNFAKLGLLYLRNGMWENERFLSPKWVKFVRTPGAFRFYGGQFWLEADRSFEMIGLFGQRVHIIPRLDLIIAVNDDQAHADVAMLKAFRHAARPSCRAR